MSKGSAKSPSTDFKALWEKYQGWAQEDRDWYKKEKGSTQARLARSGMKKGTPEWERGMEAVETQYAEKQQTLQEGITGSTLMNAVRIDDPAETAAMRSFDQLAENPVTMRTRGARNLGEMEEYYSKRFGNIEGFAGNGNKVNYQKSVGAKQTQERQGYAFSGMNAASNPWMKRAK